MHRRCIEEMKKQLSYSKGFFFFPTEKLRRAHKVLMFQVTNEATKRTPKYMTQNHCNPGLDLDVLYK